MKRFTETTKWRDPWFRKLKPVSKMLFLYMLDHCDLIGLIDLDIEAASFDIGTKVTDANIKDLSSRVQLLDNGKYFITKFITFQYGNLSSTCPAHKPIFRAIESHGLVRENDGYKYQSNTLSLGVETPTDRAQEKEKEKEKDKDKDNPKGNTTKGPLQLRAEALMRRRVDTPLTDSESKAFAKNRHAIQSTSEEDWKALEEFYAAPQPETYARKDLVTLLNNWNGEIDRAKAWRSNKGRPQRGDRNAETANATTIGAYDNIGKA